MRRKLLKRLLELQAPLAVINKQLSQLPWESGEAVELEASHVLKVLHALVSNKISTNDIEVWANIIEGRDDIVFEAAFATELKQFIHEAANPILEGNLDTEWLQGWIKAFSKNQTPCQ